MARFLRLIVVSAVLLTANAAWAASGTDPSDTDGGIDILRSSVNQITREDGRRRVVVRAEAEDDLTLETGKGSIYWQLDTRGSGETDYEVFVFGDPEATDPPGPIYCLLQRPSGAQKHFVRVSQVGGVARCAIPRWFLDIHGGIRWRLAGRLQGTIDRAPDVGWYA
jgi:hypothetical protein